MSSTLHPEDSTSSDRDSPVASRGLKDSVFKNYAIAAVGEFLGTFLFLFFAFAGTQCAKLAYDPLKVTQSDASQAVPTVGLLLYVALAFGISLAVNVWVFYRISGGIFNPAVTLGVVLLGAIPLSRALLPGNLSVNTGLGGGINTAQGLFLEAFLTFELTLTIYMLAVEKHRATFMAPIGIGLALFIAHLVGIYFTGASLNPARSFGPAVVTRDFPNYHWIYWLGPCLGSVAATGFYKLLLILEYKTVNPGQDYDGLDHCSHFVNGALGQRRTSGSITHETSSSRPMSQIKGVDIV
ncbi:aquaporin 1 [Kalaharituber pfeilii]|nr:aquaporin 1 [Kalaharituber pfeilii]